MISFRGEELRSNITDIIQAGGQRICGQGAHQKRPVALHRSLCGQFVSIEHPLRQTQQTAWHITSGKRPRTVFHIQFAEQLQKRICRQIGHRAAVRGVDVKLPAQISPH